MIFSVIYFFSVIYLASFSCVKNLCGTSVQLLKITKSERPENHLHTVVYPSSLSWSVKNLSCTGLLYIQVPVLSNSFINRNRN